MNASRRFAFCSRCETRRPVVRHQCALCGTPVRVRAVRRFQETASSDRPPRKVAWLGVAARWGATARRAA